MVNLNRLAGKTVFFQTIIFVDPRFLRALVEPANIPGNF